MKYQKGNVKMKKQYHLKSSPTHTQKKYLRINITKEVKDLYAENYKILIKKIKDDLKK